jgi:hypothetical protein
MLLVNALALTVVGCTADRGTIDHLAGAPTPETAKAGTATGEIQARCTVVPECPPSGSNGELTTVRSAHTWTVNNTSAEARDFMVVLEISDNLGHGKRKEVPGQVKAHSKVDDSTSIELVTTYREAGAVEAQARTTVRLGEASLATKVEVCEFEVR